PDWSSAAPPVPGDLLIIGDRGGNGGGCCCPWGGGGGGGASNCWALSVESSSEWSNKMFMTSSNTFGKQTA
ncbi:hypothetical protein H4219_005866, partial [Mycoemilia scoparia]